jgi:hypothetical protein
MDLPRTAVAMRNVVGPALFAPWRFHPNQAHRYHGDNLATLLALMGFYRDMTRRLAAARVE